MNSVDVDLINLITDNGMYKERSREHLINVLGEDFLKSEMQRLIDKRVCDKGSS